MKNKRSLKEVIKELMPDEPGGKSKWKEGYRNYVPKFIEEAKKGGNWDTWNKDIFYKFFEQAKDQVVASLQQGYFSKEEKEKIRNNWKNIAPLLKKLADNQEDLNHELYKEIQNEIRKYTDVNRRAATYRLIASLQPQFLCTIVNETILRKLVTGLNLKIEGANISKDGSWFQISNSVLNFFKEQLNEDNAYEIVTYPWQTYEYITYNYKTNNKNNEMGENPYLDLLEYKKQIILQGPPGTGKTRMAKEIAQQMIGIASLEELNHNKQFKIIQFHPSYTYEDFVRGIVAESDGNNILYKAQNKTLGEFAQKALNDSDNNYILIIDEINRANLSSVLGELIYALEYRGEAVETMYEVDGNRELTLPPNLYIIGTMNTADRSVGHIDYAVRRRFAFVDVLPEELEENDEIFFNREAFRVVTELFIKVKDDEVIDFETAKKSQYLSADFSPKEVALGHSYFIVNKEVGEEEKDSHFAMKMKYEVLPILDEYLKDGIFNTNAEEKIKELKEKYTSV